MASTAPGEESTFTQVAIAANEIIATGINPSLCDVHEKVGGSIFMAAKHLRAWKEARAKSAGDAESVWSVNLAGASRKEGTSDTEICFEIDDELEKARQNSELIDSLSFKWRTAHDQVDCLVMHNDFLTERNLKLAGMIDRLNTELEREQAAGVMYQKQIVEAHEKTGTLTEQVNEMTAKINHLDDTHALEVERLTEICAFENQGRIDAENFAAILQVKLLNATEQIDLLNAREKKSSVERELSRKTVAGLQNEMTNHVEKLASLPGPMRAIEKATSALRKLRSIPARLRPGAGMSVPQKGWLNSSGS